MVGGGGKKGKIGKAKGKLDGGKVEECTSGCGYRLRPI